MQFKSPFQPGWGQSEPGQQEQFPGWPQQASMYTPIPSEPQQQTGYPQWQGQQPYYPPQQPYYPSQQPQYPPQQPWPQPPMQPQQLPKKTGRMVGIGCGALVALVILIAIIASAGTRGSSSTSTTPGAAQSTQVPTQVTTQATSQPTSQPTSAVSKIDASIKADTWIVTLNTVKSNGGDGQNNVPKTGNVYMVVNMTLKNIASSAQTASSLAMFTLRDTQGNTYHEDIAAGNGTEGTVAPGQLVRGDIFYEVSKSVHRFILQFQPSPGSSSLVRWDVSV
jgi:Domain of unknown function (DUF4352)